MELFIGLLAGALAGGLIAAILEVIFDFGPFRYIRRLFSFEDMIEKPKLDRHYNPAALRDDSMD